MIWPLPLKREFENDFFVEPISPHPDKLSLMKYTNLYEVEQKYCKYMDSLSSQISQLFIGKKIKINNKTYLV